MKQKNKNIKVQNEFKIPENYFKSIEDRVFEKLSESNSLGNEGFSVPKNYFDTIENIVFEKLNKTPKKNTKIISIRRILIQVSVAAVLVFLINLFFFKKNKLDLDQIAVNDINIWFNENIEDLDTYAITELFESNEIDDLPSFNEEELINELEGVDIESILDNLDTNY